jgi:hypothetical protein
MRSLEIHTSDTVASIRLRVSICNISGMKVRALFYDEEFEGELYPTYRLPFVFAGRSNFTSAGALSTRKP